MMCSNLNMPLMKVFVMALVMTCALPTQAQDESRFVRSVALPSGQTVVVAEGDLEARSIGSFSVRLYEAAAPADATTFFVDGLICARDGTLEQVILADVQGDTQPEILVLTRSAGSGSYQAAYAFAIVLTDDRPQLKLVGQLEGMPATEDAVQALRQSLTVQ